ncbi:methyl-accepting chemotaxis protein [Jidongwangia harbinensis]|uniref:methyl-accepting chemotaxis protein n=1 Tax=Jidongwangia harbinensis TaxID=2878561 RepID=UPI001CD9FC42|nr:methyl-accepting chemotaxis protein [Jidongwangia harbinensis]MCA2212521.1 methyl-accepting chemotaxis protein [Jidongwangia harbinensis]
MVYAWLGRRRVRTKLMLLVGMALIGVLVSAAVGVRGLTAAERDARDLQTSAHLTRTALEADMAHDAIRGDVLRVFVATTSAERAEAAADLTEHTAIMQDRLAVFRTDQAPPAVREAASRVEPTVAEYLRLAGAVVANSGAGPDDGVYPQFTTAFSAVEDELPAVGDALDQHSDEVAAGVAAQRRAATVSVALGAAVAALLLLVIAALVAGSILTPLRAVAGALDGVRDGDLSRRAQVPGSDELAAMASQLNGVIEGLDETIGEVTASAAAVSGATARMAGVSQRISQAAERTTAQAGVTAEAAESVRQNVDTTAVGNEEMGASINEIARSTTEAVQVVGDAVDMARRTNTTMAELGSSSAEIGDVVKVITSIAEQTNLLALNATIEAARAGDAGKGFAVVAGEVKDLAQETAKATQDISLRVEAIQAGTAGAVEAITEITAVISRIDEIQTTIASAVEEQSATASEMARSMGEVSGRTGDITDAIGAIAAAASETSRDAESALADATEVSGMAERLHTLTARFRV